MVKGILIKVLLSVHTETLRGKWARGTTIEEGCALMGSPKGKQ